MNREEVKHLYKQNGSVSAEIFSAPLIIYGCGNDGKKLFNLCKNRIKLLMCDSDSEKWGKEYEGTRIISPAQLCEYKEYNLALAFFKWDEILPQIPECFSDKCYADFNFEEKTGVKCILCNGTATTAIKAHFSPFIVERMLDNKAKETSVIYCKDCDFYFSEYRPDKKEVENLYRNYRGEEYVNTRKNHEPSYDVNIYFDREKEKERKEVLADFISDYIQKAETVLDYAGDEGQFIPDCFADSDRYVYDISLNSLRPGIKGITAPEDLSGRKFDYIQCLNLLEHAADPKSIIMSIMECMKENTVLVLEVPIENRIKNYSDIEISEHINFFTEKTFRSFERFGLKLEKIYTRKAIKAIFTLPKSVDGRIKFLHDRLNPDNAEETLTELSELFRYKPVSLLWYITKAEALTLLNRINESFETIGNKYMLTDCRDYIFDVLKICIENSRRLKNPQDETRSTYVLEKAKAAHGKTEDFPIIKTVTEEMRNAHKNLLENETDESALRREKYFAYRMQSVILLHILDVFCQKKGMENGLPEWAHDFANLGHIRNFIASETPKNIVVMESENETEGTSAVVARLLRELGHRVFVIKCPENPAEDDRDEQLKRLFEEEFPKDYALCFLSGNLCELLAYQPSIAKNFQRITDVFAPFLEDDLCCACFGSYTAYISDIYGMDVEGRINTENTCRFSIVLPARNSAFTLKETLKTCLNQTYDGEYEIILSDNSTGGNTEVYDLYESLSDPRIKYFKTPVNLHLPKSFEYAFLQASGEYVLALGSDDGLLPWALKELDKVIKEHEEEPIIQWERAFYAWPGFNKGQQNQLVIPSNLGKEVTITRKKSIDYLSQVLCDTTRMYTLPMLYINSCFKRSYMRTILEKTGRLWDGVCQDIYMGLVNIMINREILNINYPLAVAGMSASSVGASSNRGTRNDKEHKEDINARRLDANAGGYITSSFERLIPETITDTWSFYTSFMRLVVIGVIPQEYVEKLLDFSQIYLHLLAELKPDDVIYDKKIVNIRYAASRIGEDFLQWVEEKLLRAAQNRKSTPNEDNENKRTYEIGIMEDGTEILDASEHGVFNIFDAVGFIADETIRFGR